MNVRGDRYSGHSAPPQESCSPGEGEALSTPQLGLHSGWGGGCCPDPGPGLSSSWVSEGPWELQGLPAWPFSAGMLVVEAPW